MIGFFAYLGCAVLFFALALYACLSQNPVGIWANTKKPSSVSDARGYNRAAAKLFGSDGVALVVCRLPMLFDAHPAVIVLVCILGLMAATIAMIAAAVRIDQRYKVKR